MGCVAERDALFQVKTLPSQGEREILFLGGYIRTKSKGDEDYISESEDESDNDETHENH